MSSAVSCGLPDGCITWLSTTRTIRSIAASRRPAGASRAGFWVRRHPLAHDGLGGLEQRLGVRGQQGQQLGVGAVGGRDDGLEEAVVLRQLEHSAAGAADGGHQVVRVRVEGALDLGQEQRQLAQHHLLGQLGLRPDLVVDGLPADAHPVRELGHGDRGPPGLAGQLGRRGHDALVGAHGTTAHLAHGTADASTGTKSTLSRTPQSGQHQVSGMSAHAVPAANPSRSSPVTTS